MKIVLVTGASGFIGSNAIATLVEMGYEVHAISSRDLIGRKHIPGLIWSKVNLFNFHDVASYLGRIKATHLLHFAWYAEHGKFWDSVENYGWMYATNNLVQSFINCGGRRFVISGSCAEYDWKQSKYVENESVIGPSTLYGQIKNLTRISVENIAKENNISRTQQDGFAIASYQKSQAATEKGLFSAEMIPVSIPQKKGDPIVISNDEEPFNVKFDKIAQLNPAFNKEGTVTAANASTMNDGAAALILMSGEKLKELGIKPLAKVISYADAEQDPKWFTTSPALAIPKALAKANLTKDQIDFFEFNLAYSVVGIVNTQLLKLDASKVNVNGGAVSLGHPLGCSGARIVVTLINVLDQNKGIFGAASICNGGGGASALIIEKC